MIWFSAYTINKRIHYRTTPGRVEVGIDLTPAELQRCAAILMGDNVDGVSINRIRVEEEKDEKDI